MSAIVPTPELARLMQVERLLVVDLELTCGPGVTADLQEVIEFAACTLTRGAPASIAQAESIYIRPERSRVNDFCTKLTGITQSMVANQPGFARQAVRIREMAERSGAGAWVSWGPDQALLQRQSEAAGIANPLRDLPHADIRRLLTPALFALTEAIRPKGSSAGVGLASAMKVLGLDIVGRQHSGRDDALNAARVFERVRDLVERLEQAPLRQRSRPRP